MSFIADKQTLDDLNLLGKYKTGSVYNLFNEVRTAGGEKLLEHMFQHPLQDHEAINKRSKVFRYFQQRTLPFPFTNDQLKAVENYLGAGSSGNLLSATISTARIKALHYMGVREAYNLLTNGLQVTIEVLKTITDFLSSIALQDPVNPFMDEVLSVQQIMQDKRLAGLSQHQSDRPFSLLRMARYDYLLRHTLHAAMKTILQVIYQLDVHLAVAAVANTKGFLYAHALPAENNSIRIRDLRHPGLDKAVANSLAVNRESNVIFLTGANMAGKSTFMKSFGISLYLAHMGFPVAAQEMEFSIRDGLYSSINVPDNLNLGYSHFYAEVLRVKKIAQEVSEGKNLVIIFDELFKGTNVKDAYDATLAVSEAFAENRNCSFIISTHIIEVGQALKTRCSNFQFVYFPTLMKGSIPTYTYTLQEGITTDRHGMMIIENEQIVETILSQKSILH